MIFCCVLELASLPLCVKHVAGVTSKNNKTKKTNKQKKTCREEEIMNYDLYYKEGLNVQGCHGNAGLLL